MTEEDTKDIEIPRWLVVVLMAVILIVAISGVYLRYYSNLESPIVDVISYKGVVVVNAKCDNFTYNGTNLWSHKSIVAESEGIKVCCGVACEWFPCEYSRAHADEKCPDMVERYYFRYFGIEWSQEENAD